MSRQAAAADNVSLVRFLDHLLDRGVVLTGDITISVADVDLIFLGLRLLLVSCERAERMQWGRDAPAIGGPGNG